MSYYVLVNHAYSCIDAVDCRVSLTVSVSLILSFKDEVNIFVLLFREVFETKYAIDFFVIFEKKTSCKSHKRVLDTQLMFILFS